MGSTGADDAPGMVIPGAVFGMTGAGAWVA